MQILGTIFNLKRHIKPSKMVQGRVEQAHLFMKNKIKLQENSRRQFSIFMC